MKNSILGLAALALLLGDGGQGKASFVSPSNSITPLVDVADTVVIKDAAGNVLFNDAAGEGLTQTLLQNYLVPANPALKNVTLPITEDKAGKLLSDEFILTVNTINAKTDSLTLTFWSDSDKEPKIENTIRPWLPETGAQQDATPNLFPGINAPPVTALLAHPHRCTE
jgi:hypothetical protein